MGQGPLVSNLALLPTIVRLSNLNLMVKYWYMACCIPESFYLKCQRSQFHNAIPTIKPVQQKTAHLELLTEAVISTSISSLCVSAVCLLVLLVNTAIWYVLESHIIDLFQYAASVGFLFLLSSVSKPFFTFTLLGAHLGAAASASVQVTGEYP